MSDALANWSAQQLAEFLAAVSECRDEAQAAREGVERAAEAVEAECAALLRGGTVVAAIGWPRFDVPERALAAVADGSAAEIVVPGSGPCPAVALKLGDEPGSHLVLARAGEPFGHEERTLLRAMAGGLALALALLDTLAGERTLRSRADRAAAENVRLLETLRMRQRVLEAMARIQRAISRREPLEGVLETIVGAAGELLGDDAPALLLVDPDDPGARVVAASRGYGAGVADPTTHRRRVGDGVAGRAVAEDRLIVAEDYGRYAGAMTAFVNDGLAAAMAAPVHEDGRVIGALILSSYRRGRVFSRAEQDMLSSFAEHASLALTDARRVDTMLHQALHDALTGLPNRALFTDRLQHALTRGRRRGAASGVVFLDLDRFKTVNDTWGHSAGDELLAEFARRLQEAIRAQDLAARIGGDEFAVLVRETDAEAAVAAARRLLDKIDGTYSLGCGDVACHVSVGIAVGAAGVTTGEDLIRNADIAMYSVKRSERAYTLYEADLHEKLRAQRQLGLDLEAALERREILAHFQPVVRLADEEIEGFEVLARWPHPTRGLLSAADFLPVAEEMGLTVDLGRIVLQQALEAARRWPQRLSVWLNLAPAELANERLVDTLAEALKGHGIDPSRLVIELTESGVIQGSDGALVTMQRLRELGVGLTIDDFGTGYSSLSRLAEFPIESLKIPKPFVDKLVGEDQD
jgi:diguanylate cyclase (GGDEF)-like protein